MNEHKDPGLYYNQILEAIEKISEYTDDLSFEKYTADYKTQDAVHMRLQVIGECASKIPAELLDKYSEIPWSKTISLRNIISHAYETLVDEIIWSTVKKELPKLKAVIEKMRRET